MTKLMVGNEEIWPESKYPDAVPLDWESIVFKFGGKYLICSLTNIIYEGPVGSPAISVHFEGVME